MKKKNMYKKDTNTSQNGNLNLDNSLSFTMKKNLKNTESSILVGGLAKNEPSIIQGKESLFPKISHKSQSQIQSRFIDD
jgi:hypothetical protein